MTHTPLGHWVHAVAAARPGQPALIAVDGRPGFAGLARCIDTLTAALQRRGVAAGARVSWLGTNSAAMLSALFACARLGAIFMPLNWRLAPAEHRALLARAAPRLLFVDAEFVAATLHAQVTPEGTQAVARPGMDEQPATPPGWQDWAGFVADGAQAGAPTPPAPVDPELPILLCFTSGSTGEPKGVLLSQRALAANADAAADMHGLTSADRILTTLPLFHVGGLNIQTLPALRQGCTVVLHARFDADAVFDAIEAQRITLTVLVPAQLEVMLAHPRWAAADLRSLRAISTGSTVVPRRLIDAVHARGVPLIQVWGATETSPVASCVHIDEAQRHAGSAGRAALGTRLRIADASGREQPDGASGEVLVRGAQLMSGYWHDAAGTAGALREGWFHSGDAGHLDREGFLWIDGRLKDMIISGGENVSPAEVEAVLLECPEVAEAAVVGRPDPRWGEAVVAVVAPRQGARLDEQALRARYAGRLARFKQPREFVVVDALPRTALGKVRKEELRELVARRAEAAHPAGPGVGDAA